MRRFFQYVKIVVGLLMIVTAIGIFAWIHWWHIDMTEARKFVEFWPQILLGAALIGIGQQVFYSGARL